MKLETGKIRGNLAAGILIVHSKLLTYKTSSRGAREYLKVLKLNLSQNYAARRKTATITP